VKCEIGDEAVNPTTIPITPPGTESVTASELFCLVLIGGQYGFRHLQPILCNLHAVFQRILLCHKCVKTRNCGFPGSLRGLDVLFGIGAGGGHSYTPVGFSLCVIDGGLSFHDIRLRGCNSGIPSLDASRSPQDDGLSIRDRSLR
jgi:hypothetical protein